MSKKFRIGTRESQLALWQANHVQYLLHQNGIESELVPIKSEGDLDLTTPLYAMGVQGIFTRALDEALLNDRIDLAVHSMKDVPVGLAKGLTEAAVLPRDNPYDLFVPHPAGEPFERDHPHAPAIIASSSIRRKAQWMYRFPADSVVPIRGNVNTRLKKLENSSWAGVIFAAAGLERIGLRPACAIQLEWMIPAPAQGAILVICREKDTPVLSSCRLLQDEPTAFCVKIERDFLSTLMGGCSTPIGALAQIEGEEVFFRGNRVEPLTQKMFEIEKRISVELAASLGISAAHELLRPAASFLGSEKYHD